MSYQLRKDLVVDDLLGQTFDNQRQTVKQANANRSIRITEDSDNKGDHFRFKVVAWQFTRDLQCDVDGLWATSAEFNRFHQFWQDFHFKKVFREVVANLIKVAAQQLASLNNR